MMIAARNAMLMSGAKLPYDAEVEYLESTGTQYIDTQLYMTPSACRVDIDIGLTAISQWLFGYRPDTNGYNDSTVLLFANVSNQYNIITKRPYTGLLFRLDIIRQSDSRDWILPAEQNARYHLVFSGGRYLTYNGSTYDTGTTQKSSASQAMTFLLFAQKTGMTVTPGLMRIYSCALSAAGGLDYDRDFIPVRVGSGSSAVGYLYDRANPTGGPLGNGLYGNAADGQGGVTGFPASCIGPDK